MKHPYPKDADPRPRRCRDKDNPYTIYSVGYNTDEPKYYVEFTDGTGEHIRQEISREVYEAYDRFELFELEDLSHLNEIDRHFADSEAGTEDFGEDTTLETSLRNLSVEQLRGAIASLPKKQRRRVELYFFEGMTYQQIAEREGCARQTIQDSVSVAQ